MTWKKKTRSNGKTTSSLYFIKRWLQWDNKVPTRRRRRHPIKGKYPKDTKSSANNVRPKALESLVNTFCYFPYLLISLLRLKTQYFTRQDSIIPRFTWREEKKRTKTNHIKTDINDKITKLTWEIKTHSNGKTTSSLYLFKLWLQWDNKVPTRRRRRHPKKGKTQKTPYQTRTRPKALESLVNKFCYFPYLLISLLRLKTQYFTRQDSIIPRFTWRFSYLQSFPYIVWRVSCHKLEDIFSRHRIQMWPLRFRYWLTIPCPYDIRMLRFASWIDSHVCQCIVSLNLGSPK